MVGSAHPTAATVAGLKLVCFLLEIALALGYWLGNPLGYSPARFWRVVTLTYCDRHLSL